MSLASRRQSQDEQESAASTLSIDVDKVEMQPMYISTGSRSSSPTSRDKTGLLSVLFTKGGFMLCLVTTVVLLSIFVFPPVSSESTAREHVSRPVDLRPLLSRTTAAAVASGALVPLTISDATVMNDDGMLFYVSYSTSSRKPVNKPGQLSDVDVLAADAIEPGLVVAVVPPLHTLILNKYSTFPDHALLITRHFEKQAGLLTLGDIEAWHYAIVASQAVGFYNSGPAAGASQSHKHMQLIPLDSFVETRTHNGGGSFPLPLDDVLMPYIQDLSWASYNPFSEDAVSQIRMLPQFKFRHGVAVLLEQSEWELTEQNGKRGKIYSYSDYLYTVYLRLLTSLGMTRAACSSVFPGGTTDSEACVPYNVILTKRWMLVVPRSKGDYRDGLVKVNGFGFIGFLLARNSSGIGEIRRAGPSNVLKDVCYDL